MSWFDAMTAASLDERSTPDGPPASEEADRAHADVEVAVAALLAHGRREDALTLVTESAQFSGDSRGALLAARLHLEPETKEGAKEALEALDFLAMSEPSNVDCYVLFRRALSILGRADAVARLDRRFRWGSLRGAASARHRRRLDFGGRRRANRRLGETRD